MSDAPSDSRGDDRLRTRFCELVGCRLPIVQTGMGWVSGASLTAATSAAGGFGILAAVTMTRDQLAEAIATVQDRTDAPFGVNLRARRPAEKLPAWGVDAVIAQGGAGGGHTGRVPTSLPLPQVVDAGGHAVPVLGAGGFHDGRGLVAALAWGADGVAMGTRFLLTAESRVPDAIKARYLAAAVTDTVVTTAIDGAPQRVVRTPTVERLERASALTRLPRALRAALAFRRVTGTPLGELVREGLAMRRHQSLTWSQVALAANAPMLVKAALVDGRPEVGV